MKKLIQTIIAFSLCLTVIGIAGKVRAAETDNTIIYYLSTANKLAEKTDKSDRIVAKIKLAQNQVNIENKISYDSSKDAVSINGLTADELRIYSSKLFIESNSNITTLMPKAKLTIEGNPGTHLRYGSIVKSNWIKNGNAVSNDESSKQIIVNKMSISGKDTIYAIGIGNSTTFQVAMEKNEKIQKWEADPAYVNVAWDGTKATITSTGTQNTARDVTIKAITETGITAEKVLHIQRSTVKFTPNRSAIYAAGTGNTASISVMMNGQQVSAAAVQNWGSSDGSKVTVSNGVVTGKVGASGSVTITGTVYGIAASCAITVVKPDVRLNLSSVNVYSKGPGQTASLRATVNGQAVQSTSVAWSSSASDYVSVDANGTVTGKKTGTVTITGTIYGVSATCSAKVSTPTLSLDKTTATVYIKGNTKSVTLKAVVNGTTTNSGVTWKSDNKKIATVDGNGKVTSVATGTVKITATANGVSKSCTVTVKAGSIKISGATTVKKGKTITLAVTSNGKAYDVGNVTFTSSDKSIATVSTKGVVTGKKKGTVTITAVSKSNLKDTIKITVK